MFKLRCAASMIAIAALMGGCMARGPADLTGSLGGNSPVTEPQWRTELQTWSPRHEANPGDRTAAFRFARALRALGQHAQAVAVLQNAVLKHPNDLEILGAYGRSLMDTGQLKQAEEVLARAHLPERPDWRILSAQGAVSDQLGEHPRAQSFYEAALKINPGEPTIMSNLGLSYALSKRLPEAERILTEAVQHPRADKRVRQNLVLVLGLQGRFKDAEQIAQQDLSPPDAARSMIQLRQMVSQPNSWDMLRQGGAAGRTGASQPASRRRTAAPASAPADQSTATPEG